MTDILVTPDTFKRALRKARAGDRLQLRPGCYNRAYSLRRRNGTKDKPIVIEPAPGVDALECQISQGVTAEQFRPISNLLAKKSKAWLGRRYPGLHPWSHRGGLRIKRCKHVVIRGLAFRQSWPTHIYIQASRDIAIQDCTFEDATFAIVASGSDTRDLLIENCSWVQDMVPDRIWQQIPWERIHGANAKKIDKNDYRLFDGDFFRSNDISGGVTIRHCSIKAAFNAIHGFNASKRPGLNRDFHIHHNRFEQIRDNIFEPEDGASNWWFHHNDIVDGYKWFSVDCVTRGPMYIFSNTGSFRSAEGSDPLLGQEDTHVYGTIFKPIRELDDARGPFDPLYVFHNSFIIRGRYVKKGVLPGLQHRNNAIAYRAAEGEEPRENGFFGNVAGEEHVKRFTTNWDHWYISFDGDVICYPAADTELKPAGYDLGPSHKIEDPGFAGSGYAPADFIRSVRGNSENEVLPVTVKLPSGEWTSTSGLLAGTMQNVPGSEDADRFEGPAFETTLSKTPRDAYIGA